jgi:5-methylcytosine-specific restriction endonuclease McrA
LNKEQWEYFVESKGWWEAYSIYLSSKNWKDKREKRLKIDNNECRTCGSQERLEIHHKPQAYKEIPNESVNDDLTTLCDICHEAITSSIRQRRYSSRDIKIPNYQLPREAERELLSYGVENSTVQVDGREPPHYAQWRSGESAKPNRERTKEDFWQAKEDRRRFRGVG